MSEAIFTPELFVCVSLCGSVAKLICWEGIGDETARELLRLYGKHDIIKKFMSHELTSVRPEIEFLNGSY